MIHARARDSSQGIMKWETKIRCLQNADGDAKMKKSYWIGKNGGELECKSGENMYWDNTYEWNKEEKVAIPAYPLPPSHGREVLPIKLVLLH